MKKMRRFVVGDIHGAHKALVQCLRRSAFDVKKDLLISLGDICDGWPEVDKVLDELLQIKRLKVVLGNHDQWTLRWINEGWTDEIWTCQGGTATLESYGHDRGRVPDPHYLVLKNAPLYFELDNKLFVHGGVDPQKEITRQDPDVLLWDRELLLSAFKNSRKKPGHRYGRWEEIYVGHTPTLNYNRLEPLHFCNVRALDTGAGWGGKLTLMDIDSHEYWQSDVVTELYPNTYGRRQW